MSVYVISRVGVYEHFVPGAWSTLDGALDHATALAADDGYHDWNIYAFDLDAVPEHTRVGILSYAVKGHFDYPEGYDFTSEVSPPWVPASGLLWEPT